MFNLKDNVLFSFDDGHRDDLRLALLLRGKGIPTIFFIPNYKQKGYDEETIKALNQHDGIEIGGHTVNHPHDIKLCSNAELNFEVIGNKVWLEGIIDKKIDWFCYPRGRRNDRVDEVVKNAGYKYARGTVVGSYKKSNDFIQKTSVHVYPNRQEYNGIGWYEYGQKMLELSMKEGDQGFFHLWGHSYEITKFNQWNEFERFLVYLKSMVN